MAKVNLDMYLTEIYQKFIAINDEEYRKSREIFNSVFHMVKDKMSEQCPYFKQYSSEVLFAGSVYDGIKISKLDEFDMDIVIRLPVNYEEIIIENDQPGFVKLKINSFDHLDKQKHLSDVHMVIRDWRDSENYLLQNKFRQWLHGIVQKAINVLGGKVKVGEVSYKLKYKQSGPAFTLNIRNEDKDEPFLLDVDLVPVIKFQHPRWPDGYRQVDGRQIKRWLVVPKPNKAIQDEILQNRCWRLSFQDHERDMMNGCNHLKMTIKLVKKLRDVLGLKSVGSYYIKTLFLWKIEKTDNKTKFKGLKISLLFRDMVQELHQAVTNKNLPYFWRPEHNLLENLADNLQRSYSSKIKAVLNALHSKDVGKITAYLLTPTEIRTFIETDFYKAMLDLKCPLFDVASGPSTSGSGPSTSASGSITSASTPSTSAILLSDTNEAEIIDGLTKPLIDKIEELTEINKILQGQIEYLTAQIRKLENDRDFKKDYFDVGEALEQALELNGDDKSVTDDEEK